MSAGGPCKAPLPPSEVPLEQRPVVRLLCHWKTKLRWCHLRHPGTLGALQSLVDSYAEGSCGSGRGNERVGGASPCALTNTLP